MENIRITFPEDPYHFKGFAIIETKYLDPIQIFDFILTFSAGDNRGNLDAAFNQFTTNRSGGSTKSAIFSPGKDLN